MLLIAHGGYSSKYPENTQLAYEKALEFKPDGLEMDVVFHDNQVYFYHPIGNKNSFGDDVDQLITSQLHELLMNGDEVFSFSNLDTINSYLNKTKFLYLDIKQRNIKVALNVFSKISDLELTKEQIYIGVRELKPVKEFKKVNTDVSLVALDQDPTSYKQYIDEGVEYIRIWYKDLSEKLIEDIRNYGGKIIVNHKMQIETSIARESGNFSQEVLIDLKNKGIYGVLLNDIELGRRIIPSVD